MIDWPVVLIVPIAVVILAVIIGGLLWWYVPADTLDGEQVIDEDCADGLHEYCLTAYCDCSCHGEDVPDYVPEDDEWAAQLHAINQLGKFGDLTRPVHLLTYYEVEALIVELGVPDWLPEYRMAA